MKKHMKKQHIFDIQKHHFPHCKERGQMKRGDNNMILDSELPYLI